MLDEDAIREIHKKWLSLELGGKRTECTRLCTEDVVFQPPIGAPISGIDAVGRLLRESGEVLESVETRELQIEASGDLAVKRARFRTRVAGVARTIEGGHIWVLRRLWRGWQVAYVAWSFDHTL